MELGVKVSKAKIKSYAGKYSDILDNPNTLIERTLSFLERNPAALDWLILALALGGATAITAADASSKAGKPSTFESWSWGDILGQASIRGLLGPFSLMFDPKTKIELPNVATVGLTGVCTTVAGIAAARLLLNTQGASGALDKVTGALGTVAGSV